MEPLRNSIASLNLWDKGLLNPANPKEFETVLNALRDDIASRLAAFHAQPATSTARPAASTALEYIRRAKRSLESKKNGERLQELGSLSDKALIAYLALFPLKVINNHRGIPAAAFRNGALQTAKWSTWHEDLELQSSLRKFRGKFPLMVILHLLALT